MSQFKLSVIRKDGMQHESTFAGWLAERSMIAARDMLKNDAKTLFVAVFEGNLKLDANRDLEWKMRETIYPPPAPPAPPAPGQPPFQGGVRVDSVFQDNAPGRPTRRYIEGAYVEVTNPTHPHYGLHGRIEAFEAGGDETNMRAVVKTSAGDKIKLLFADMKPSTDGDPNANRLYKVDDYVAIVGKDHAHYGHNGQIVAIAPGGVTLRLTSGRSLGERVSARKADITPE